MSAPDVYPQTYDPKWFDHEFFAGRTGIKGGKRDADNGILAGHAIAICDGFPSHREMSILTVGDGMGWTSRALLHMGWGEVTYSDISPYAVEHNAIKQCACARCRRQDPGQSVIADVRDLGAFPDRGHDVVSCINVLGYLAPADVPQALSQLERKFRTALFLSVSTEEKIARAGHGSEGRLCIRPEAWWRERFTEAGLVEDAALLAAANRRHPFHHVLKRYDTPVSRQDTKSAKG